MTDGSMPKCLKEARRILDRCEYPEPTDAQQEALKALGAVAVCGCSDDLVEFYGAYREEFDAWQGTDLVSDQGRHISCKWNEHDARKQGCWTFLCDLPCFETFRMMEDGHLYCKGIIYVPLEGETWEKKEHD